MTLFPYFPGNKVREWEWWELWLIDGLQCVKFTEFRMPSHPILSKHCEAAVVISTPTLRIKEIMTDTPEPQLQNGMLSGDVVRQKHIRCSVEGSANPLCKGPRSKCFQLRGCSIFVTRFCPFRMKAVTVHKWMGMAGFHHNFIYGCSHWEFIYSSSVKK